MDKQGVPADASSFIYLAKAGGLRHAAACLGPLLMTPRVWIEVVDLGERRGAPEVALIHSAVAEGFIRRPVFPGAHLGRAQRIAEEFGLGLGESEVLAVSAPYGFVLLDERRASRVAGALGITAIGTIVVPALCARTGVLDRVAALEFLDAIARNTTLSSEILIRARRRIMEALP